MTSQDYLQQVINPIVRPIFSRTDSTWHGIQSESEFVEDRAKPHGVIKLHKAKEGLGITVHYRPASSPDLNPVEYAWKAMK